MHLRSSARRSLVLIALVTSVLIVAGVAMADDPDGNLQQAIDLIEAEIAKPPVVTTVTETVTATVTTTVTETVTETPPPPTTPPPTTPPPSVDRGVAEKTSSPTNTYLPARQAVWVPRMKPGPPTASTSR